VNTTVEETPERIRVLIVDDHAVVRRGLRAYLEVLDDMEVAAEAEDGEEALTLLRRMAAHGEAPDVVLLDLVMPRLDGVATTGRITREYPDVKVVILTSFGEMERVHAALGNGASGYLLKSVGPNEVAAAIRAAARDEMFLDPAVARRLTREMISPSGVSALTEREREVVVAAARGLSNAEIADRLYMSESTVKAHMSRVLAKLALSNRVQAAILVHDAGLLD